MPMVEKSEYHPLNDEQVREAFAQLYSYVQNQNELYKIPGNSEWDYNSVRGVLYKLGYHGQDCEQMITLIAKAGFDYCMDPQVPCKDESGNYYSPNEDACHWAPDQLLSRLHFIDSRFK